MCVTCKDHTIRAGAKLASSGGSNSLRRFLILRKTRGLSEQRNKDGQSSFSCSGVSHFLHLLLLFGTDAVLGPDSCCYSALWQYRSFSAFSSSIRVLFWFSNTATRFSRHLTYSFFFLRHSRAASLKTK